MAVPKTPVDEDAPTRASIRNVWPSGQLAGTDPVAHAEAMKERAHVLLRRRVALPDSLHSRCRFGRRSGPSRLLRSLHTTSLLVLGFPTLAGDVAERVAYPTSAISTRRPDKSSQI